MEPGEGTSRRNRRDSTPGRHRSGRSRLIAGMLTIVTAVGAAAWLLAQNAADRELSRKQEKAAEERQAREDAGRLIVDHSYPGHPCDYTAVGWEEPTDEMPPVKGGTVEAIRAGAAIGGSGVIQLHLTLPTIAGKTAIDVRAIHVEAKPVAIATPAWELSEEGCGGGQYSQGYLAKILKGRADVRRLSAEGEALDAPFEPFSVTPGETVHINYELASCDSQTYDLRWNVEYVADTGGQFNIMIPKEGSIRITSAAPQEGFYHLDGLRENWATPDASLPYRCETVQL